MHKETILAGLTLALAVGGARAQTADWTGGVEGRITAQIAARKKDKKPPKAPKDESEKISSVSGPDSGQMTPEQLACQPDVIEGFKRIFAQGGYGSDDTEAGMRIDLIDGQRVILVAAQTHQFKKMEIPTNGSTIAIAHTHPGANFHPSGQDESASMPNFVVTRFALWVTNPHPAKHEPSSRKVRDGDWMRPCQETK